MKSYLKVITNIFLTSISLSVLLGSMLVIIGPIYQNNKANRKINRVGKQSISYGKELLTIKSDKLLFKDNKLKRLERLINKWQSLIIKNPDLEVSCFFFSLDNEFYAEINSDTEFPAASSIKVPILIILLRMIDSGEILWDEELSLTQETIGSGAGWMAYQAIGEKFPVFEVATEMIRVSDNTATNLLIKRIGGIDKVNQKFKEIGLKNTQINNNLPDLDGTNLTSTQRISPKQWL